MKEIKFGAFEGSAILINSLCFKMLSGGLLLFAEGSGPSGWLYAALVWVISFAATLGILKIIKNKLFAGRFVVLPYVSLVLGLLFSCLALKAAAEVNKLAFLYLTPYFIIGFLILVAALFVSQKGYEAVSRIHALFVPLIFTLLIILVVSLIGKVEINNIFPILGDNIGSLWRKMLFLLSAFSECWVLYFIAPYLQNYKTVKKAGIISLALSGVFFVVSVLYFIMLFPYPKLTELTLPFFDMLSVLRFGRFLQHFEIVYIICFNLSALLYLSNFLSIAAISAKKITGFANERLYLYSGAALVFALSFLFKRIEDVYSVYAAVFPYLWAAAFVVPLIVRRDKSAL